MSTRSRLPRSAPSARSPRPTRHAPASRRYGWIPDLPDRRDFRYAAPLDRLGPLPHTVSLRGFCPPVYDQGALGSCTANAIAAAMAFDQRKQELAPLEPSRLFIYYNERVIEGTAGQDAGAMLRDGIKSVARLGAPPEPLWPYVVARFRTRPSRPAFEAALQHQAQRYERLTPDLDQLKGCLASGFPFVFGFAVYESFESAAVARTGTAPLPKPTERLLGGHAVLAVGYDDRRRRFEVRNSWGTSWGASGYFTLPYAYVTDPDLSDDFWTLTRVEG